MNNLGAHPMSGYRDEIVGSLTPVRPLPPPLHRVWMLLPAALLLAAAAPLLKGERADLERYVPLLTWGVTGLQSVLGTDQKWVADINKARALGLAPAFIAQFVQQGPSSLATLDALVNGSPGDIGQINSLGAQISGVATNYGQQTAAANYGAQFRRVRATESFATLLDRMIAKAAAAPGDTEVALHRP